MWCVFIVQHSVFYTTGMVLQMSPGEGAEDS